jgi:hypothetical protein
MVQKQRARDRSDAERTVKKLESITHEHTDTLNVHANYLRTLADINAMMIENINMQMEAETADLLDRRMMQLYAVANKNMTKQDVHNASSNLKKTTFGARL